MISNISSKNKDVLEKSTCNKHCLWPACTKGVLQNLVMIVCRWHSMWTTTFLAVCSGAKAGCVKSRTHVWGTSWRRKSERTATGTQTTEEETKKSYCKKWAWKSSAAWRWRSISLRGRSCNLVWVAREGIKKIRILSFSCQPARGLLSEEYVLSVNVYLPYLLLFCSCSVLWYFTLRKHFVKTFSNKCLKLLHLVRYLFVL